MPHVNDIGHRNSVFPKSALRPKGRQFCAYSAQPQETPFGTGSSLRRCPLSRFGNCQTKAVLMDPATSAMVICIITEKGLNVNPFMHSTGSRIAILLFVDGQNAAVGCKKANRRYNHRCNFQFCVIAKISNGKSQ